MESPGKTIWTSPTRAWQGAHGIFTGARQTGSISWVAARSLFDDLLAPRSVSEQVMANHARTFRFATRFLPSEYREPTLKLYAFFRTLDDLVDDSPGDEADRRAVSAEIEGWDAWFRSGRRGLAPRQGMAREISLVAGTYQIPSEVFLDFLAGMRADLHPATPTTREEVEYYSYQVASTVGITMAHVFGTTGRQAMEAATRLGIAMQLTNILRDVGGDLARGRVYLPKSLLDAHGLTAEDVNDLWISGDGPDERLRSAIREMVSWADDHYAAGVAGVRLLPSEVRMPILVSARLYQRILRQLEQNNCDSLRTRAATTRWHKVQEAFHCAMSVERADASLDADTRETRTDAV